MLVDDQPMIRQQLRRLLELKTDHEIVGDASNGLEAIERVDKLSPEVILMDMNMPGMNGAEATKVIKQRHPEVKILALTAFGDMALVSSMVEAGASGYLLKGGSANELVASLEAVAAGGAALDHEVSRGLMDDMAELYRRERARSTALAELNRMKSEFVSVVSHELRTPLTSIKGGIGTLRKGWEQLSDDVKLEFLDSMDRQSDRLIQMVKQILTVAGIQRGGLGLNPTIFSLQDAASKVISKLEPDDRSRIDLDLDDAIATGDRELIEEVAESLIENALLFTTGRVRVSIFRERTRSKLVVEDEGPGIDEEMLQKFLNEPFSQGDSSNTRSKGGLGVSLYIARQVLEACGGRLDVHTNPESGSSFSMVLLTPAAQVE